MSDKSGGMSLNDLFVLCARERDERLKNGLETEKFILKFNQQVLSIEILYKKTRNLYFDIDLSRCVDAVSLLDWILYIHAKNFFGDRGVNHAFLTLLDDILEVTFVHPRIRCFGSSYLREGYQLNWAKKEIIFPQELRR